MENFESPIQFSIEKKYKNVEIVYSELMEITQGGPEVGNLAINGKILKGRYGGPAIYEGKYVYVPAYVKKFLGTGFKLARININTHKVEYLSKIKNLIYLDKIDENRLYFFDDLNRKIPKYYELG